MSSSIIQLNSRITLIKDHVVNVTFRSHLQDILMIYQQNADIAITRDVRSRIPTDRIPIRVAIKKMWSWLQLLLTKMSHGVLLSSLRLCHCRRRRPDWTRDIVRRIRSPSRSWTLGLGRILLETDVLTMYTELSVAVRELDEWYERSSQNVSRDRLNKIHYSDHVKSQYSVILRHVTRLWIYFINQKLHRITKTNALFSWRMLTWFRCTHEQFWFFWSSWPLWSNWNENQIIISLSFRIPVVLVKWNEKTYPLNIIHIYIYIIFVERDTDMTVNEQEDTPKKLIKKFLFRERTSKLCSSDVVVTRETDGRDRITSSRKRFLYVDVKSKRWKPTELWSIQRIRRWRFLTEWSLRYELDRSHQYIGL